MAQDVRREGWLTAEGVQWSYRPAVSLDLVDIERSLQNQARLDAPLNEETVSAYVCAYREGADFPALTAYETREGRLILVDGNHRYAAARKARRETVDVYIVHTEDAYVRDRLTRTANGIEGVRLGPDVALEHAMHLIEQYGRTAREAAAYFHLAPGVVQRAVQERRIQSRLRRLNIKAPLRRKALGRLNTIANDPVFQRACDLAIRADFTESHVARLVQEIAEETSEAEQVAVIDAWIARPDVAEVLAERGRARGRHQRSPRSLFFQLLRGVHGLVERYPTLERLQLTGPEHRQEARRLWRSVVTQMRIVFGETQRPERENGHDAARPGA